MKLTNNTYYAIVTKSVWGNRVDNNYYEVDIICSEQDTEEDIKGMIMRKISKDVMDVKYELVNSILL